MVLQEDPKGVMMTKPSSKASYLARTTAVLLVIVLVFAAAAPVYAEGLPPAPDSLSPVAPVTGTLFICGGGKIPEDVLDQFVELAGGTRAHLVIITTASETADSMDVETRLEFWRRKRPTELTVL